MRRGYSAGCRGFSREDAGRRLGDLTLSVLRGQHGHQRKEVEKLIEWIAEHKPEVINLSNIMLSGIVAELRRRLGVPILCSLQGDDIYLDFLPRTTASRHDGTDPT